MVKVGCAGAREDEIEGPANPPSHCTLISSGGTACRVEPKDKWTRTPGKAMNDLWLLGLFFFATERPEYHPSFVLLFSMWIYTVRVDFKFPATWVEPGY